MGTRQHTSRNRELRAILTNQRQRVLDAVRDAIHAEREAGAMHIAQVEDTLEQSDANVQSAIDFSLAEMQSETLAHIDDALQRLATGQYGQCADCDTEISAERLRAIPFATRCRSCAEEHERDTAPVAHTSWERNH